MQILEVKNNLVKISYDTTAESLILSGFVVIKDTLQSFIGQIIHLESVSGNNVAVVKLLFNFDDQGVITNYNGSIPSSENPVELVHTQELLGLLPIETPIFMGELAQQGIKFNVDKKIFDDKLLICCEKEANNELLVSNFVSGLTTSGNKVLAIDLNGTFDFAKNKITACKDFKLPLNYDTINFIYEKGLEDASIETKALIQDVFLEVQEYIKTLPEKFIPFESFKAVVDSQYEETEMVELLLLKNKLLKYYDEGVFAQETTEFESIKNSLENNALTLVDLSKADEKIQREIISFIYSTIEESDENYYVILNINDENTDKKLLKKIYSSKKAFSTTICEYSYKYLKELKQLSKNLILFAPTQQQNDFAAYNVFLNKINANEFVIYGQITHHMPLIVKLEKAPESEIIQTEPEQHIEELENQDISVEEFFEAENISEQELLEQEIISDVDKIYSAPRKEESFEENEPLDEDISAILTEDDLDFIQNELGEEDLYSNELAEDISSQKNNALSEIYPQEEIFESADLEEKNTEFENQIEENFETEEVFEIKNEELSQVQDSFSNVMMQQAQENLEPPSVDILPANMTSTPIVPIYQADVEPIVESDEIAQGDSVSHPKYGKGIVEKIISYGNKTLCSINFDNVGRRLLDPNISELKKI